MKEITQPILDSLSAPVHFLWVGFEIALAVFAVGLCWNFYRKESRKEKARR